MRISLHHKLSLLTLALLAHGCGSSHSSIRTSFNTSTGSAYIESHDGGPALVAFYEKGEIHGAEAYERILASHQSASWLRRRSAIDHPSLPEWRHQLLRAHEIVEQPDSTALELVSALPDLPFRQAREDLYSRWIGDSNERAADLLDYTKRLAVGKQFTADLCSRALRTTTADDRSAGWMAEFARWNQRDAAVVLASSKACGPATARIALRQLGDFSSTHRRRIFTATAPRLAGSASDASLIVTAADELSSKDETQALRHLLVRGQVDVELSLAALRSLDDRPSRDRLQLFKAAIDACITDPAAAPVIARALGEITSSQRLPATKSILAYPKVAPKLIGLLIDQTGRLPSRSREVFLTELIRGRHFRPEHRKKCEHVARRHLSRRSRERVRKLLAAEVPRRSR